MPFGALFLVSKKSRLIYKGPGACRTVVGLCTGVRVSVVDVKLPGVRRVMAHRTSEPL